MEKREPSSWINKPSVNGGQIGDDPLGRIKAQDADGMETFQPQADESLGAHRHIMQVLLVRPLDPLIIHIIIQKEKK